MQTKHGRRVEEILARANVSIGTSASCDIQVKDENFIREAFAGGDIAIGEGYMDGKWWCNGDFVDIFCRIFEAGLEREFRARP